MLLDDGEKRIGRPPLPECEKLAARLTIALTTAEAAQLRRQARAAGYRSLSTFVRVQLVNAGSPAALAAR